jgi:hypothetical protein
MLHGETVVAWLDALTAGIGEQPQRPSRLEQEQMPAEGNPGGIESDSSVQEIIKPAYLRLSESRCTVRVYGGGFVETGGSPPGRCFDLQC